MPSSARAFVPLLWVAFSAACSPGATPSGEGDAPVAYEVSFPNAVHHEARVAVTFSEVRDGVLELRMSRTSPGRYALHEFAKNVYDVTITDGAGAPLSVERPNLHQWNVRDHDGTVHVEYTLFGDRGDGTYAQIDPTGALLNGPASWLWARQLRDRPVRVRFVPPPETDWSIATQLEPQGDPHAFGAPDFQYLMDSPVLLGEIAWREWEVPGPDGAQTIRFALRHQGSDAAFDDYARMVQAVVREQGAVYGEFPTFDYGTYTFLGAYLPWISGDGMEHRNSTVVTRQARLPDDAVGVLGTVAHEFFHAWNVERIRPASLEPFDFEEANVSELLWLAEGFTSYYDDLTMTRAGILDAEAFGDRVASMVNGVVLQPGHRHRSPVEMSMNAPFVDAAVSIDPQNRENIFISYYTWGSAIALALDLTLRREFDTTLDAFMRILWERHGKPFRPYTLTDVHAALAEVSGDTAWADAFFELYMVGNELPDFAELLATAGFEVAPRNPERPSLRLRLSDGEPGARVVSRPLEGTAAYGLGLEAGDVVTRFGGSAIADARALVARLEAQRPGETVEIEWTSRTGPQRGSLTLEADPTLAVRPAPGQNSLRDAWLRPYAQ